jgi:hypothetical protein
MSVLNTPENLVSIKNVYSNMIETSFKIGLKEVLFSTELFEKFPTLKEYLESKYNIILYVEVLSSKHYYMERSRFFY